MTILAHRPSRYMLATIFTILVSAAISIASAKVTIPGGQANDVGQVFNDAGTFSVVDANLGVAPTNQSANDSPCLKWGSTQCISVGGLSAGHWYLSVELRLNTAPTATTTYSVSVQVDSNGPPLQPIEFAITNSTAMGSTGRFCWDFGTSFSTPLAFTVGVQELGQA
jgi:hypothetical protein